MKLGTVVVSFLFYFVALLIHNEGCHGCLEKERTGLLEIKAHILSLGPYGFNESEWDSWVNDTSSNCCAWNRVKCSNISTGNVTHLSLGDLNSTGPEWTALGPRTHLINGSLFRPFEELLNLDLSFNGFQISEGLPKLTKLETLDLSYNWMNGLFSTLGLCKLQDLQELGLNSNEFSGQIPECLSILRNLQVLDLSQNLLSGNFPSFISNITSLTHLSLVDNYLQGSFSLSTLANHSKLQILYISSLSPGVHVETEKTRWFPSFQLKSLMLRSCNLNMDEGRTIPSFLQYQNELQFIDLSHNKLVGAFPSWLIQNNSRLGYFYARNNSLVGNIQLFSIRHYTLHLDISNNNVSGLIPKDIGTFLHGIRILNLSTNNFEGSIPTSIGKMQNLSLLDLSHNRLSGELPEQLGSNTLEILILSNNHFHGNIPKFSNDTYLKLLLLNDNNLNCTLEEALENVHGEKLEILDISNNLISGEIPSSIMKLSFVSGLFMANNQLEGKIPFEFLNLRSLYVLDLSQNRLSGSISHVNFSTLMYLNLKKNVFSGSIPITLSEGSNLVTLDLRDNNFSGNIPYWMDNLSNLRMLSLGENNFIGYIPIQLCRLQKIAIMDLSHNKIKGSIPSCFNSLPFGREEESEDPFGAFLLGETWIEDGFQTLFVPTYDFNEVVKDSVEFRTKHNFYSYSGNILRGMSGMDLSSNMLTGNIPFQIGKLQQIRALNLSHNYLSGCIPNTFSNFTQIESLDLSYNNLSGEIPSQLTKLNTLAIFNVSYNNLSGIAPSTGQFGTFVEDSYRGNPFLCGPLLKQKCEGSPPSQFNNMEEKEPVLDMVAFYWSFTASYITILLGFITVLCINAYGRMIRFYFIAKITRKCFPSIPLY